VYSPDGERWDRKDRLTILMVEGNLSGGYEVGLENGMRLASEINTRLDRPVSLTVVGNVPAMLRNKVDADKQDYVQWVGRIPPEEVLDYYHSAHVFFAGDPNPACPNAVIEALACGLPVVAYGTGAIPEIIQGEAGRVASYGGNVWMLDRPNVQNLVNATVEILEELPSFQTGARERAEEAFDLEDMVESYLSVFTRVQDQVIR
jgi:glycosyltransferase involved in cell wall biosynthesis